MSPHSPARLLLLTGVCLIFTTSLAWLHRSRPQSIYDDASAEAKDNYQAIPPLYIKEIEAPPAPPNVHWFSKANKDYHAALLIAGSYGYENYRHQADVCHAYRILRERGLKDDNIITFVYDDIAYSRYNPYPGHLFNAPGGSDVYPGCAKDYTGYDVNKYNVVAVLTGNAFAVSGIGSGRVLNPHPQQRVFMFYSDHGSAGSIAMPSGQPLSARELKDVFTYMYNNNFFEELVFYLESCESGSIFQGFQYQKLWKMLAVSASSPYESSYGAYCPTGAFYRREPTPYIIGTCMGDLFSVSWMEFTEATDNAIETIGRQLFYTAQRTSAGKSAGGAGSSIRIYGREDLPIYEEVIGNFFSYFDVPSGLTKLDAYDQPNLEKREENEWKEATIHSDGNATLEQRDADLVFLMRRSMSNDLDIRDIARAQLEEKLQKRDAADRAIRSIIQALMDSRLLKNEANRDVEAYAMELFPRGTDEQIVEDWDCFESFVNVWYHECGEMDSYSQQYTRTFANLCNAGIEVDDFTWATARACATNRVLYPTT